MYSYIDICTMFVYKYTVYAFLFSWMPYAVCSNTVIDLLVTQLKSVAKDLPALTLPSNAVATQTCTKGITLYWEQYFYGGPI